ncbi:hypothetical protein D3C86_1906830 [compost metagenome]
MSRNWNLHFHPHRLLVSAVVFSFFPLRACAFSHPFLSGSSRARLHRLYWQTFPFRNRKWIALQSWALFFQVLVGAVPAPKDDLFPGCFPVFLLRPGLLAFRHRYHLCN